jgi:hypothetical protein
MAAADHNHVIGRSAHFFILYPVSRETLFANAKLRENRIQHILDIDGADNAAERPAGDTKIVCDEFEQLAGIETRLDRAFRLLNEPPMAFAREKRRRAVAQTSLRAIRHYIQK